MTIFNLATLPGYYYLYALYFDYPLNTDWFSPREYDAQVREALHRIQPVLAARQPVRKSMALRLFTEREALARYSPEEVSEAWRELKALVELLGPPPHWPHPPAQWSRHAPVWKEKQQAWQDHQARRHARERPAEAPSDESPFPKPPIDYRQRV